MMIRLLYLSQAAPQVNEEQVRDILQAAHKNNPPAGITGVLIRGGGMFMQVLEGPEHTVLRQYVKILDDRRHSDCRILFISPASERIFDKWSMGLIESHPLHFEHIAELRSHRLEAVQAKTFTGVMSEFVRKLNEGA